MKIIYVRHLDNIRKLDNNAEKLTALTSTLRSLLQTTAIIIFEVIKEKAPSDEIEWDTLIERFNKPSDGTPIDAINTIIPIAREYISRGFIYGWFEIAKGQKEPLANQLRKWIEFRNKRPGHGVLDKKTTDEWSLITESLIENTLIILGDMIPTHISNQVIKLQRPYSDIVIKTPLINNNHAIVITGITPRKGIWKLKGQLLSLDNAEEFTVDLSDDNVFSNSDFRQKSNYSLSNIISKNKEHSFFHNIPVRQTDTFEGRKEEIQKLIEWFDDQDSRFCLVYGDGGYGKTTLVLEFLNQYLDSQFDFDEPLPTLVLYHTAKMTRWSEKGLVHLTGVNPMMDECIRDLIRFFIPILTPDWYSASGRQLIDKAVSTIRDQGLTRNDILLILDNTETLATTSQEVKELGEFFKSIGKLIGRVIITSRRRELIGANPIPVEGLSDNEAVSLMNALAQEYHAKPILQAGEKTLKRIANSLNNKPILLEALVKFISRSKLGIEDAVNNVFKKTNEDLLNFLYEDAWARISKQQKEIFLVSINISSPLDQISISKICQEIELQHSEFHSSLAETHFAILTDYGKSYTLELVDLAKRFFFHQFSKLDKTEQARIKQIASITDTYFTQRMEIENQYKADRVAEAFRTEYAKAAKVYADRGDIDNAISMYELALEDDPLNSALHDRFSWFLLSKNRDLVYARTLSEKAIELDENNCDAIVVLAIIHYRIGDLPAGDRYIDIASKKGRSFSFCLLRKAIARYHKARNDTNYDTRIDTLDIALALLDKAEKILPTRGGYDAKNRREISNYIDKCKRLLITTKGLKTRNLGHPPF